ncbi:hypothetical protein A2U01_0006437, partial [Trifolium medium]|nr:hypothetical protein [Trifolium medium]
QFVSAVTRLQRCLFSIVEGEVVALQRAMEEAIHKGYNCSF